MRTDIPADCEKTQAPPSRVPYPRNMDERYGSGTDCCEAARPLSSAEILAELFKYHAPTEEKLPKYASINQAAKNFAEVVLQNCPSSVDRSDAIRKIREARMVANAAVALNGLSL